MRRRTSTIAGLLLFALALAPASSNAKKKRFPALMGNGVQMESVPSAESLAVAPKKPCVNYTWAAVLESMLQAQQAAPMSQTDWVVKTSGGDKCFSALSDYGPLMRYVDGDYYLPDQRKVRISTQWMPGPPTTADPLILSFRNKRPLMMVWKNKPFLLYGISYGEMIAPSGHSYYTIEELKLIDPSLPESDSERKRTFLRGRDDPADIQGVMDVRVEPR